MAYDYYGAPSYKNGSLDDYYFNVIEPNQTSWFLNHVGNGFYAYSDYENNGIGDFIVKGKQSSAPKLISYVKKISGTRFSPCEYSFRAGFLFEKELYVSEVRIRTINSTIAEDDFIRHTEDPWDENNSDKEIGKKYITEVRISRPALFDYIPEIYVNVLFGEGELSPEKRFKLDYPYAFEIQKEADIPIELFYCFPAMELLYKAGYGNLVSQVVSSYRLANNNGIGDFNSICKNGTDMKSIFRSTKNFYKEIRGLDLPLADLDAIRRIDKKFKLDRDSLAQLINLHIEFDETVMNNIEYILKFKYQSKALFTCSKLVNYLRRIDMYEAIDSKNGIQYLADYMRSCRMLRIKPRINSDSLIREHNVTARLVRQKKSGMGSKEMQAACKELQKYCWSKGNYFIRGIRGQNDLLDEATQQNNCLASYENEIIKGNSKIFVMRRCWTPDKSLITIEMSKDMRSLRQARMANNRDVTSQAQLAFIREWLKAIRDGETKDWENLPKKLTYNQKCIALDEMYKSKAQIS